MRLELEERLLRGAPLLLDAAMGTELEARGVASGLPLWSARALIEAPETVLAIHRENVAAGADILTANTFRTHRRSLLREGLGDRAAELTRLAVELARRAAGEADRRVFVAGSLSPLEDCYRPDLAPPDRELESEHAEQARALATSGVDAILAETHNTVGEIRAAVAAAVETGVPVIASVVTDDAGRLLSGETLAQVALALATLEPVAISINCVPARKLGNDLRVLAGCIPGRPLGAYGNLVQTEGLEVSRSSTRIGPEDYADLARGWLDLGARLIGGCCGTTAAHTAALARLLDSRSPR